MKKQVIDSKVNTMEFEKNKLEWLEFDLMEEYSHIFSGTFLRHGGTSIGPYVSLNASLSVGDHPDSVKVNREMIRKQVGLNTLTFTKQIHSDKIFEVTKDNVSKIPECDALITKDKDIGLVITHADCQAAIFYDKENEVIGAVHAGWKGMMKNIYGKFVDLMINKYHSKPENIIVCISPSLCDKHAEFKNYKEEFPKEYWSYQTQENHFDLWEIARNQLKDKGIHDSNIEIAGICTYCNPKDYYSYRHDKVTGRHATVIGLRA